MAKKMFKIAIDAFGGDNAPRSVVKGLNYYCKHSEPENVSFVLFGDRKILEPMLRRHRHAKKFSTVYHTTDVVAMDAKPSKIIRTSTDTSLWQAIKFVKNGSADSILSAGNTGCLMAMAKLQLRTMEELKRPAITTIIPCSREDRGVVMLDLGANSECSAQSLKEFAVIGALYYKTVFATTECPRVGVLNIGTEDNKGLPMLQEANDMLRSTQTDLFNYVGFVESSKILNNFAEVIVTDGFSGNIALKSIEGTASLIKKMLEEMFRKSWFTKLMYFMMKKNLERMKKKIDPNTYNGALMAGLNGLVVKAHGGSNYKAFRNAVDYTVKITKADFNTKLKEALIEDGQLVAVVSENVAENLENLENTEKSSISSVEMNVELNNEIKAGKIVEESKVSVKPKVKSKVSEKKLVAKKEKVVKKDVK